MGIGDFFKFSEKAQGQLKSSFEGALAALKNGIASIKGESRKKFVNFTQEVLDLLPVIEKAGYATNEFIVGITIPPSVDIHVTRFKTLSKEEADALLKEHGSSRMARLILKTLFMASSFQQSLSPGNMAFTEIWLEISIPPKVSLRYIPKSALARLAKEDLILLTLKNDMEASAETNTPQAGANEGPPMGWEEV